MPRGRNWYGPGFWKRGTDWVPGSVGFRGGAYFHGHPWGFPPRWPGWGPCHWFTAGYGPYPPWAAEPDPRVEAQLLREEAEALKAELQEIEKRLAELEQEETEE